MKNLSLTFCLTITALWFGGLATALHANTYQLTCIVDDSKFTTNYLIDENAKTIFTPTVLIQPQNKSGRLINITKSLIGETMGQF